MTTQLLFHVVMSAFIYQGQGVVNFALNKSANQSTTLNYNNFDWTADKAVDGNSDGRDPENSRTCSATILTRPDGNHIWEVDIGVQIIVKTITVYGRNDKGTVAPQVQLSFFSTSRAKFVKTDKIKKDQLHGVTLYLGNTSGPWKYGQEFMNDPWRSTINTKYVFKPNNVIGRFISFKRFGKILTICEVTVEGGVLETVTPGDDGPNTGVIIGFVLAAVGVSISAMVIFILIVKKRKRNNNETGTEIVTPFTNYANLVVGNPDAAIIINVPSREERETASSAIEGTSLQNGMPICATNSHSGVMEADVPAHNVYEKLRDVPESTESAYSTIDQSLTHDQKMNTIENGSNYIETLQELESALNSIEEEIGVLLDRKRKLLCKELERSRAIKLRDKRKETDSIQSDTNKDYTYVNLESKDALEFCGNFVGMLQSLEGELRLLEEKRNCLFERKEILLRQELATTFKI